VCAAAVVASLVLQRAAVKQAEGFGFPASGQVVAFVNGSFGALARWANCG